MSAVMGLLCGLILWLGLCLPSIALTNGQLIRGERLSQAAMAAAQRGDLYQAEKLWSDLIDEFPNNPALWSNRGNIKAGLNQFDAAIADLDEAIRLAPDQVDGYFNRGAVLEQQGRFESAIADYNKAISLDSQEAIAYHNRGNVYGRMGDWEEALENYQQATKLDPRFAWAAESYALALYQVGEEQEALQRLKGLVRKYPMFVDARVALTAALWGQGKFGEAESNWVSAEGLDKRYQDLDWLREIRHFPPKLLAHLEGFFTLQ